MTESYESQRAALTVATAIARSKQPTVALPLRIAEGVGGPLTLQKDDSGIDQRFSRAAPRLRSFVVPILVFGFTSMLAAIGINKLKPEQPKPPVQIETRAPPSPKQNGPRPEEPVGPVERAEPFSSLALDAAQSCLATGSAPRLTMAPARSGR
jgi:hypothetical protein